jgi:hypothetical protein
VRCSVNLRSIRQSCPRLHNRQYARLSLSAEDQTCNSRNDGQITGDYTDSNKIQHGFLRTKNGVFHAFDPPGAALTLATAINRSGEIVGFYVDANQVQHGFLRNAAGTIVSIDPPSSTLTNVTGIAANGLAVGYYQIGSPLSQHGFLRKSDGTIVSFDPPGSDETTVFGVNDAQNVVGNEVRSGVSKGFVVFVKP